MSATQIRASCAANVMKFEGPNSINGFITQAIGREPFLSFACAEPDFSLLHHNGVSPKLAKGGVDHGQIPKIPEAVVACTQPASKGIGQPDKCHPGWPLLSTSPRGSFQLHKCSKCSREFCSVVNYKRHIRVHRRSLVIDKASQNSKELLGAFWDSLSLDAIKEIVSLDNVKLEHINGSSFFAELSWIGRLTFICVPQDYIKAGKALLDIIQATSSIYPIPSYELFRILDNASEKTFLCAGTAISLQKFLFDKETLRASLDSRNIIACVSFMLEQKLVNAYLSKKDAEALKCQMLLMEEEEAAQRRQAALSEKRRLKKLKQKENKSKETKNEEKHDSKEGSPDSLESLSSLDETVNSMLSDLGSQSCDTKELVISSLTQGSETEVADVYSYNIDQCNWDNTLEEAQSPCSWKHATVEETPATVVIEVVPFNSDHSNLGNALEETQETGGWKHAIAIQKPRNQFPHCNNSFALTKHACSSKDMKFSSANIRQKVWAQKTKNPTELRLNDMLDSVKKTSERSELVEQSSVLIGSMTICLNEHDTVDARVGLLEDAADKPCYIPNDVVPSTVESQRSENNASSPVSERIECDDNLPSQSGVCSAISYEKNSGRNDEVNTRLKDSKPSQQHAPPHSLLFSRTVAEDFLKRRWELAVASEHQSIDSSSDSGFVDCCNTFDGDWGQLLAPKISNCGILGSFVKPKDRNTTTGSVGIGVYKLKHNVNKEKVLVR